MARSQRWQSKRGIEQSLKYIDCAKDSMINALGPYFERFPEKRIAAEAVLAGMDALKLVIEESFNDI